MELIKIGEEGGNTRMPGLRRIIIHWTAGTGQPNCTEYEHYHYLVNADGVVIKGKYSPEDNENCNDGEYAAHTGGGNTGSIGLALCGMNGFVSRSKVGRYPLNKEQCERFFKLIAQVASKYKIPIDPTHVMTHYEFGKKNPKTSSVGKIDIVYLPPYPEISQDKVGNFIRSKARWYASKV